MQKRRKLFSPTALAATVATGLLITAAVAYAADEISVSADTYPVNCQAGQTSCSTILMDNGNPVTIYLLLLSGRDELFEPIRGIRPLIPSTHVGVVYPTW